MVLFTGHIMWYDNCAEEVTRIGQTTLCDRTHNISE